MKKEKIEKFDWKKFILYMSMIILGLFVFSLISFKLHLNHLKVVKSVEHCIEKDDIYLISTSSKSGSFSSITPDLEKADFIIRNKKQIPIEDICEKNKK